MKKFFIIAAVLLFVASVCIGIWQKDNISAVITSNKYSKEEIKTKISQNNKTLEKTLEEYTGGELRGLTEEEETQIKSGEKTAKEVFAKILSDNTSAEALKARTNSDESSASGNPVVGASPISIIISEHVANLYQLKNQYMGSLDALFDTALAEYKVLAKEKGSSNAQKSIISKYYSTVAGLEASCDAQFNSIVSSLERQLKAKNTNLEIIKTIKRAYQEEKVLKRAYYINSYTK